MYSAIRDASKLFLKRLKTRLRDAYWDAYGSRFRKPVLVNRPRAFLFLCQGNICRSPFAERFARRSVGGNGLSFISAGIDVSAPNPPPAAAVSAAQQFAVQMTDHRSQPLTNAMMQGADAILVMEIWQLNQLKKQFPQQADKIHPLALFEDGDMAPAGGYEKYNIRDPYGRPVKEFIRCYRRIGRCVNGLLQAEPVPGAADAQWRKAE